MTTSSFKKRTSHGLFWSFIDKFGQQLLHFIITVIIARKLAPSDYGLVGMLSIFLAIATTFVDSGLGEALIQKKQPDYKDFASVFLFNISIAVLLYIILFFCAPIISNFYKEPQLTKLTRVLSLNLIFISLSLVQITILKKEINFKTQTIINLIALLFAGFIGIFMAYYNYGVWALVIQMVVSNALKMILFWLLVKWKPVFVFDLVKFKKLFDFSSKLLISWITNQFFANIYSMIIGKYYNANLLGFYTQSRRLQEIPVNSINTVFQNVTYPLLAEINNNKNNDVLKNVYRKLVRLVISLNFPLMIVLIIISKPLIITLLTTKWEQSVEYFQLFCLIGLIYPLTAINLNITKVKGKTRLYLNLVLFKRFLFLIALLLTINMGIKMLIIGQIIASYIGYLIEMKFAGALIDYKLIEQMKDISTYLWISILVGIFVYIPSLYLNNYLLLLLIQITIGLVVYVISNWIFKTDIFIEFMKYLNKN